MTQLRLVDETAALVRGPRMFPPDFDCYRHWDQVAKVVKDAMKLAVEGKLEWPLTLFGEAGSGKTCAALCINDYFGGWYMTLAKFSERIRLSEAHKLFTQTYPPCEWTTPEIWRDWRKATVGIVDEIGLRKTVSDHQYEVLKQAIDVRYGTPTILISNLSVSEIEKVYDDRIASRILAGTQMELSGDRRAKTN